MRIPAYSIQIRGIKIVFLRTISFMAIAGVTCVQGGTILTYNLGWMGSNGYTMSGNFSFNSDSGTDGLIDGTELLTLSISGYQSGNPLGNWKFTDPYKGLEPFNFNFDPSAQQFFTGGNSNSPTGQNWNDDGNTGSSCGNPGIGFNDGNFSRDLCVNGVKVGVSESRIQVSASSNVPEPSTMAMFGIGLACAAIGIRFRHRQIRDQV